MRKEEVVLLLKKMGIVSEWFDENADRDYSISFEKAAELIMKLEEVK